MGINADAFKNTDFQSQLVMLHDGLAVAADKGNAMADALAIGGRGMANNIPFLEKMSPDLLDVAKSMSMVWSEETIKASKEFSVDLGLFEGALGTVADRIGAELLPVMSALLDVFVKSPTFINGVIAVTDTLAHGLGLATIVVGGLSQAVVDLAAAIHRRGHLHRDTGGRCRRRPSRLAGDAVDQV
jgi:hypothetical protein